MKARKVAAMLITLGIFAITLLLSGCGSREIYSFFDDTKMLSQDPEEGEEIVIFDQTGSEVGEEEMAKFKEAYVQLTFALFQECALQDNNVMISPLSAMTALSMTANGADNQTLEQMEKVLGNGLSIGQINQTLSNYMRLLPSSDQTSFQFANSIWYKDKEDFVVYPEFVNRNVSYYDADIFTGKFDEQTLGDINQWVDVNTNHMITKIADEIDPNEVMFLINAIVFEGKWKEMYEESELLQLNFYPENGSSQKVLMMNHTEGKYLEDSDTVGFIKPYKDGYSFVALLPKKMKLSDYEKALDAQKWNNLLDTVSKEAVYTRIPKFTSEYSVDLSEILQRLGMQDAFIDGAADFSKMCNDDVCIGSVLQKTFIEVDENGTKAAAVTAVTVECNSIEIDETKEVYLDRPFLYAIVDDESMLPIFIGEVENVTEK